MQEEKVMGRARTRTFRFDSKDPDERQMAQALLGKARRDALAGEEEKVSKDEMVRLNLKLSAEAKAKLDRLVERTGAPSMTEAVRRALSLYDLATANEAEGGKTVLRTAEGAEQRILMDF